MNERQIICYMCISVVVFIVLVASNNNCSENKLKGRYIALITLFWPVAIVIGIASVLRIVSVEMYKVVKENFWKCF